MAMALAQLPSWPWRGDSNTHTLDNNPQQQQQQQGKSDRRIRASSRARASAGKSRRRQQRSSRSSSSSPSSTSSSSSSNSQSSARRPWKLCRERPLDEEFDMVLVHSDGCCMSGSESDDSDWSVGWLEPHSTDFSSDSEDSFAVLVPCYGTSRARPNVAPSTTVWAAALLTGISTGGTRNVANAAGAANAAAAAQQRKHVQDWLLSSLH